MALEAEEHFKTPEWVSKLENKHKKHHKLAHEIGSGSSCLNCLDKCPGLDLHFWRKVCKNCKCKKEEHNITEDDQFEQFEILFNDSKSNYQPVKATLNMIIKSNGQIIQVQADQNQNTLKFDWIPPNVNRDLASEYMQQLPSDKLPISGSEGALYRRQQLEKQVPLHDFNANVCHNLTKEEENAMSSYLKELKENAVGLGFVKKLTDKSNPLSCLKNLNLTTNPFKTIKYCEDNDFPPPPSELLYPDPTNLKTPLKFVKNKSFSEVDRLCQSFPKNSLDNVNNNQNDNKITLPTKPNISNSQNLSQKNDNVFSVNQNDNFTPSLYEENNPKFLKNKKEVVPSAQNDVFIVPEGKKLFCKQCSGMILPGEIAVLAERTGEEVLWHPSCFVCTTCKELLVDLVYFFFKGNVYCGRHYAESLNIPRCLACDELIFLKEYTIAENHTFHVRHFCCFECDKPLAGLEYVQIDNQPVCLDCYQVKYGKKCETCHKNIFAGENRIGWKDLSWHESPACFKCYQCFTPLLGKKFTVKDENRPLCSKECVINYNNSTEI
ncbi:testin [Daktulosphaira vitifoliae]|uniref:testin n=1 Tax=Daktulosphaira vitifoliae TaxID=58002 RepID=UPI0021AA1D57|nr:testin [Daktulosphaira vitifoliae]XP_050530413.1 testin [Daktulosphaira vitifoliae]XP_050530420.1 testin [Daktulosphaira vitifoliae]